MKEIEEEEALAQARQALERAKIEEEDAKAEQKRKADAERLQKQELLNQIEAVFSWRLSIIWLLKVFLKLSNLVYD